MTNSSITGDALTQRQAAAASHVAEPGWSTTDFLFVGVYAWLLVAVALITPLQIPELLGIAWSVHYSWAGFLNGISQSTDPSPLGYLIQFPFVFLFGTSRLGARVPGLLFAVASALLFLQLTKRIIPRRRYTGLFVFLSLPLQLLAFTSSIQFEAGTFFVLLALLAFFALVEQPGFKTATVLTVCTAACLLTDHHAGLPIFGSVLFLLRFCPRPQQRKALWFALGSCVGAVAAYIPFYIWAATHASTHWLTEPRLSITAFPKLSIPQYVGAASIPILAVGVCLAAVASFRISYSPLSRRLTIFCLLGSALLSLGWLIGISYYAVSPIAIRDLMFAAPVVVVLFVAGVRWADGESDRSGRFLTTATSTAMLVCFAVADIGFLVAPKQNLALESRYVAPELTGDSCVIFVSENFSRPLFFLFQPQLEKRECDDFFHHRIVLASHPYVRPDEQNSAEAVFRGLNFTMKKRVRTGGGQIVVFENEK
jgi:4-amino-4-deoxy-L-arabinose transferase-like glycosyltransferase